MLALARSGCRTTGNWSIGTVNPSRRARELIAPQLLDGFHGCRRSCWAWFFCPTQRPMRNGVLPQRYRPFSNAPRRIISQAHIKAVARWNCWIVSNRSVYRISTAMPFSPDRPATVPCSRRRPIDVGGQAQVGFGLAAARGEEQQVGQGLGLSLRSG